MDGTVQHLTFRVKHDCPLARLSRELSEPILVWSGHRLEVVVVPNGRRLAKDVAVLIESHLRPERMDATAEGWTVVWRPPVDPKSSISRILEAHGIMWQQPLRVHGGWEHYDGLSFQGAEQAALDALRKDHPTQVVRRQDALVEDATANLFLSLGPALEAPTQKQCDALVAAWQLGYYQSPRGCTTADVAASIGITRSSFEERLRGAENRVMAQVAPSMALRRANR